MSILDSIAKQIYNQITVNTPIVMGQNETLFSVRYELKTNVFTLNKFDPVDNMETKVPDLCDMIQNCSSFASKGIIFRVK